MWPCWSCIASHQQSTAQAHLPCIRGDFSLVCRSGSSRSWVPILQNTACEWTAFLELCGGTVVFTCSTYALLLPTGFHLKTTSFFCFKIWYVPSYKTSLNLARIAWCAFLELRGGGWEVGKSTIPNWVKKKKVTKTQANSTELQNSPHFIIPTS